MGDLEELKRVFGQDWDWSDEGEQWSSWWGGTAGLWYAGLLPRIHAYVPTRTILEIAPGYGRWTQYLKGLCEQLKVVDLAPNCIDHCKKRFAADRNIEYHVNDGSSLSMIDDASLDFVFSWDSLVHADIEMIEGYIAELRRTLTPDGVAFVHHSNVAAHKLSHEISMRAPNRIRQPLINRGMLLDVVAWRSPTVSAQAVRELCGRHGLACISQEIFNWEHGGFLTEAISVVTLPGSRHARPTRVCRNRGFRREARRTAELYGSAS